MTRTAGKTGDGATTLRQARGAAYLVRRLLAWYDKNKRAFPWRAADGERPDPYRVWLSEIMLQQTTVAAVAPYYRRFLEKWPDVHALARAELDDVLREWQGLGYYARARNLHACARAVSGRLGGRFPESESELRMLPGIGAYTAGAIASIAFGRRAAAVDGNVERVLARLFAVTAPLPAAKTELREHALHLAPASRAGDFVQALMDLGATICTPRTPACLRCPWRKNCAAYEKGIAESLPRRAAKRARPLRHGVAFLLTRSDGAIWLRRRPDKGLLGGMMEVPSTPWREAAWDEAAALRHAPIAAKWRRLGGRVRHGFTHFELEIRLLTAPAGRQLPTGGRWVRPDDLAMVALPTVMQKLIRRGLAKRKPGEAPPGWTPKRKARPHRSRHGRDIVRGGIAQAVRRRKRHRDDAGRDPIRLALNPD